MMQTHRDPEDLKSTFSESQTHGAFHSHFTDSVQPLIELIDSLRFIGIDEDIDLPSIAVVGDQSSGKSSVLEALSGVALPRGSGIITRCPLELKLRKLKKGQWSGTISYHGHKETFYDPLMVDNLVRKAQNELAGNTVGISDELISLEISSPDGCDLTLIDLPGITRVPVHDQPDDIGDQKSLPYLTEQIDTKKLGVRDALKKYDQGPPLEEEKMGPFLSEKKIEDIQLKQEAKVEKRIKEFINMEQLVFTQDKIIYQRLTDYVPMLLILFMLKDAAKTLRHQMLEMRNGADVVKLLKEDSEQGRRRADLKQRLQRLTQAQELINNIR
ncbi:interferon-induced GTP-binding Mx3-like protein [Labeo rohita]|uniref:Interferon-induced GTP-binding Mx3-like protein n=1 Tax=Labeo rohita TaxID=84645 RepID=A0A498LFF3_LABRO|nr:interferon-induced GTP-binding Mx3-like protein [Labeo rohita]